MIQKILMDSELEDIHDKLCSIMYEGGHQYQKVCDIIEALIYRMDKLIPEPVERKYYKCCGCFDHHHFTCDNY
jgi:hypothetical protein